MQCRISWGSAVRLLELPGANSQVSLRQHSPHGAADGHRHVTDIEEVANMEAGICKTASNRRALVLQ